MTVDGVVGSCPEAGVGPEDAVGSVLGSLVGTFPVSVELGSAGQLDGTILDSVANAVLESWTAIDVRECPFILPARDADTGVAGVAEVDIDPEGEVGEVILDTGINGGRAGRTAGSGNGRDGSRLGALDRRLELETCRIL